MSVFSKESPLSGKIRFSSTRGVGSGCRWIVGMILGFISDFFLLIPFTCKLVTVVEGNQKAPFSIATTPRCRGGRYSFLWIAPFYP